MILQKILLTLKSPYRSWHRGVHHSTVLLCEKDENYRLEVIWITGNGLMKDANCQTVRVQERPLTGEKLTWGLLSQAKEAKALFRPSKSASEAKHLSYRRHHAQVMPNSWRMNGEFQDGVIAHFCDVNQTALKCLKKIVAQIYTEREVRIFYRVSNVL